MASEPEELQERYQAWVDAVVDAGEVWIIGDDEHNTVFEDPDEDRDLHLMFSSRRDAQAHADRGEVLDPIPLADLIPILEKADGRGDGLALWHGDRWIVADPGPLADELRERT
jgi:hypothetical protein